MAAAKKIKTTKTRQSTKPTKTIKNPAKRSVPVTRRKKLPVRPSKPAFSWSDRRRATIAAAVVLIGLFGFIGYKTHLFGFADELFAVDSANSVSLRFGSFNIANVSVDENSGARKPWRDRRPVIVDEITSENLDVIGVQEASPSKAFASRLINADTQMQDLVAGLNRAGGNYALTNNKGYNCVNPDTPNNCVYQYQGASNATRIVYNKDKLSLVSQGSLLYTAQASGTNNEYLAYAVLQSKTNGHKMLFTSTHLDPTSPTIRRSQWNQLINKVNQMKGSMPVINVGDYNTNKFDDNAKAMLPAMKAAGYGDVLNQQYEVNPPNNPRPDNTANAWINSYNHWKTDVASYGYEDNHNKVGNGIDWIFATNSLHVKYYKLHLHFMPSTLQVVGTLPSDHNMIYATIVIP